MKKEAITINNNSIVHLPFQRTPIILLTARDKEL